MDNPNRDRNQDSAVNDASGWAGVLGVGLVLGFAVLAMTNAVSSPRSAYANSPTLEPVNDPPMALYGDEGGAHTAEAAPAPPLTEHAVGMFDTP